MPELLDPQQAQKVMVALPGSGARPVSQGAPQRPAAPPSPFQPAGGGGPRILLLPHEESESGSASSSPPSPSPARQADDRDAVRLARSITPEDGPERFAAQAPPGGIVVKGLMYTSGQMLPAEATTAHPAPSQGPPRRPARDRLRAAMKGRQRVQSQREGRPVRNSAVDHEAFRAAIDHNPHDQAPWGVYADYLDESGLPAHAHAARRMAHYVANGRLFPAHVVGEHRPMGDNNFVALTPGVPSHGQYDDGYFTRELLGDTPELRQRLATYRQPQLYTRPDGNGGYVSGADEQGEGDLLHYPTWAAHVDEPLEDETMRRVPDGEVVGPDGAVSDEDLSHAHEHVWEHSNGRATLVNAARPSHFIDMLAHAMQS